MLQVTEELRAVEEILLLILDTDNGEIRHRFPLHSRAVAFAGAVLMDLALENRIDTNVDQLIVTDPSPLGNELLDPILAEIAQSGDNPRDAAFWITHLAGQSDQIRERALTRLIERGYLEGDTGGQVYLSPGVSRIRRYTTPDGTITEEVQLRIMRTLFSDDIPDPRDIVIISLAAACGVFESILSQDELAQVQGRIDLIGRMDLIGREVAAAIREVEAVPPPAPPAARPTDQIPQADGLPLLGNVFGMAGDLRAFLLREYRQHGPIFRVRALHHKWVALVGPEANVFATQISPTHFRSWEPYHEFSAALGAHRVLLSMDGPEHLRMRRLLVKGYSPRTLESNLDLVHDITRRAIDEWPPGQPIGIQHVMQQIITEQIGMFCSGLSSEEYIEDLIYFLAIVIQVNTTKRLPKAMERLPRFRRAKRRVTELYQRIMETHQRERGPDEPLDFVDELLEASQTDPQFLPETDLFANVLAPYLVGMDTSASVCAFMLYALLKHPEILERMRAEVEEMYEDGPPTPEGLRKLDVTRRVALETMRMYPVIPALTRTVSNSFEFEGYRVPAGAQVMLGTTVGHHLPEYFPEPDRFDIERYSRDRSEHLQPGAFAPFGVDRHRCIGSSLAELQIILTLATIVREADLELERPDRPLKIKRSPAAHPDDSVRMRLVRRRTR
ncbi:MAG: cytochrome P450 [Chloroflexi bacterium]|nr:cytochrome P450 [Chloroflexota bacterium]